MSLRIEQEARPGLSLAVVAAALFIDMLAYGLVVPVIPVFSARLGATPAAIGILFASYGFALLVATPVLGAASTHVRRRTLLVAGLAGLAATTVLFAVATSFAVLLGARVLQGIAAGASWTAGLALLADTSAPERRGRTFGLASTASALGTLLGPPVGGALADRWGYHAPFVAVAVLAAVAAAAGAVALGRHEPRRADVRAHPSALLGDRRVLAICAVVALSTGLLGVLEPMLPLDLSARLHASSSEIGLLFAASTVGYGLVSPLVGWATDRVGAVHLMRLGWVGASLIVPLLALPATIPGQVVAMAAFGAALAMIQSPSLGALAGAVDRVGGDHGVAYAAYNAAYAVGIMFGAGLGGPLVGALGPSRGFAVVAVASLVGGVVPALRLGQTASR